MAIFDEILKFDVEYVAGGATQNAIRIAQWMSRSEGATSFVGCIGNDDKGKSLEKACEEAGVNSCYYVSPTVPTGVCCVPIVSKERTLVTKLEACNEYPHSHTLSDEVQKLISGAKIFYIASFFLTVPQGPETILHVAEHSAANGKIFSMNLSADFLIDFFTEPMLKALPFMDYVFSNEHEAGTLSKKLEWNCSLEETALRLSAMPKQTGTRGRTVVFSQGANDTIVAHNGKVTLFPVPKLSDELLHDTNGAGDAFVGGFLARLAIDASIEECIRCGHYAARVVIQRSGCTVPSQPDI